MIEKENKVPNTKITFGKAHNLDVTVGAEVSPRTISKLLTNFINGLQKSKRK